MYTNDDTKRILMNQPQNIAVHKLKWWIAQVYMLSSIMNKE